MKYDGMADREAYVVWFDCEEEVTGRLSLALKSIFHILFSFSFVW